MAEGPYIHGLMEMEGDMMIVQLMDILKAFTLYLLVLLVWMVIPVGLMRSVPQKWLQHM